MLAELAQADRDSQGIGGTYRHKSRINSDGVLEIEILDDEEEDEDIEIIQVKRKVDADKKGKGKQKEKAWIPAKRPRDNPRPASTSTLSATPKINQTVIKGVQEKKPTVPETARLQRKGRASSLKPTSWRCASCSNENDIALGSKCAVCRAAREVLEIDDD